VVCASERLLYPLLWIQFAVEPKIIIDANIVFTVCIGYHSASCKGWNPASFSALLDFFVNKLEVYIQRFTQSVDLPTHMGRDDAL
jgi:hypothetical protein